MGIVSALVNLEGNFFSVVLITWLKGIMEDFKAIRYLHITPNALRLVG